MTTEEAYQILGLDRHATAAQVKQAYRRRALEWHPDRWSGDEAKSRYAKKFLEARDAYEYLRREGFPGLKDDPAPEPDFGPKTAGRSFAPERPEEAALSDKLGLRVSWNLGTLLLWGVLLPMGLIGTALFFRFILRKLGGG